MIVMINRLALVRHPRLQATVALLVLFLQRTPLIRVVAEAEFRSGLSAPRILRSAFLAAVSLGTLDAQTGSTQFDSNPASPASAKVGEPFQLVFAVTGARGLPGSWEVIGSLPPGLTIQGAVEVQAGNYRFNGATGSITGVPTKEGTYQLTLTAWQFANQEGDSIEGGSADDAIIPPLVINVAPGPPSLEITSQPQSAEVNVGESFNVEVEFQGSPAPTFQWRKDGQPIPNETGSTFSIAQVTPGDAGSFAVVVTNTSGSLTSDPAVLTVLGQSPVVSNDPLDQTTLPGGGATFAVSAEGNPTPQFQWMKDGVPISGATDPIFSLAVVSQADVGTYTVEVSNVFGSVVSSEAVLSIDPDGFSRLSNLSTRTLVNPGATLIPGFAIQGSSQASVMARAVGPTLTGLGVVGAMPDPRFRLVFGGNDLFASDNWGDLPNQIELEEIRLQVGAFPLDADSADAALLASLDPGPYTVPTVGVGGSTGVVLVELYDTGAAGVDQSRLVNLSARSEVGTGSNLLIPGFVIEGNVAKTVLIRAVGPTLSDFNVQGVLEDPLMRLYAGTRQLASNDNWGASDFADTIAATAQTVGAFPLDPASMDSALQITLNPGAYTVQVAGVGGTTGVCLVEVYEVSP